MFCNRDRVSLNELMLHLSTRTGRKKLRTSVDACFVPGLFFVHSREQKICTRIYCLVHEASLRITVDFDSRQGSQMHVTSNIADEYFISLRSYSDQSIY